MQASTASMCLRRLSDWVYSQSRPQAWLRSRVVPFIWSMFYPVLYLFSLFIHQFFTTNSGFYLNFLLTIVSSCLRLRELQEPRGKGFWRNCPLWQLRNIHGNSIGAGRSEE